LAGVVPAQSFYGKVGFYSLLDFLATGVRCQSSAPTHQFTTPKSPAPRAMGVFALALRAPSNTPMAHKCEFPLNTFAARFLPMFVAVHIHELDVWLLGLILKFNLSSFWTF
jgi:hypothetical protein